LTTVILGRRSAATAADLPNGRGRSAIRPASSMPPARRVDVIERYRASTTQLTDLDARRPAWLEDGHARRSSPVRR
jgi:hypothetical protein